MGNIGIPAFTAGIHCRGRVAISRAVGHHSVGIRCDGTRRGSDVRVGTARRGPINGAIDVVAGNSLRSAGLP